jgi:hypothetical protein
VTAAEAATEVRTVDRSEAEFLEAYLASRPAETAAWHRRWFDAATDREEVARREGVPLGTLLRAFNETAPLGPALPFECGGYRFRVRAMHALCDDFHGPRFGGFGEPLTLRVYADESAGLPEEMYRLADWNFMDGGRSGFLGYDYGTVLGGTYYVSGVQSDIAQRYTYLFLARGDATEVREGDRVVTRETGDLRERLGEHVPAFRRMFQRKSIPTLLGGAATVARELGLGALALRRYDLDDDEVRSGNIVRRVYEGIPAKVPGRPVAVRTDRAVYPYHEMPVGEVDRYVRAAR